MLPTIPMPGSAGVVPLLSAPAELPGVVLPAGLAEVLGVPPGVAVGVPLLLGVEVADVDAEGLADGEADGDEEAEGQPPAWMAAAADFAWATQLAGSGA